MFYQRIGEWFVEVDKEFQDLGLRRREVGIGTQEENQEE